MLLVIDSLGGGHTHTLTDTQMCILISHTEAIKKTKREPAFGWHTPGLVRICIERMCLMFCR